MKQPAAIPARARVLIVDDHQIVRQALAQAINQQSDLTVCGEAADAASALSQVAALQPNLMLVDISLTGANGLELMKNVHAQWPSLPMLALSMHDESLYAERCLRAGARGYVMKRNTTGEILAAMRKVLAGELHLSAQMSHRLLTRLVDGTPPDTPVVERLSDRELEVLTLLGHGHGTRRIADELHLSVKTVESHRAHIKEKLDLRAAPDLARFAVEWVAGELS